MPHLGALGVLLTTLAQPPPPTGVRVELYTIGPGEDLFSKFGHAALCVFDGKGPGGRCFNYGTADFSTPGPLTWDVARGRAEFWVSVTPIQEMLRVYMAEDRTIYRQVLPLATAEADEMRRVLETAALPENRYYLYDHFDDNCSTRPRDHVDVATRGALSALIEDPGSYRATFRELVRESLQGDALPFLATELFLGRAMDRGISEYQGMFMPKVLRQAVHRHLGIVPEVVYARKGSPPPGPSPLVSHRMGLALGIGLASGLLMVVGTRRTFRALRGFYGLLFGSLGSLLALLAVISPLTELRYNELLLVIWPTDFFLLRVWSKFLSYYTSLRSIGLVVAGLLIVSGVLVQPLWPFWLLAMSVFGAIWARCWFRRSRVE